MNLQPCRRYVGGHEPIGRHCDDCGHQMALHAGAPNPGLDACLACLVGLLLHLVLRPTSDEPGPTSTTEVRHLGASDGSRDAPDR